MEKGQGRICSGGVQRGGMIRRAKRNFEKRLANEKGSSNRPFYAYVKKKTKSRSTIGPLKDKENF